MRVSVEYTHNGKQYAYDVPEDIRVEVGDVVRIPRTYLGAEVATVTALTSSYTGPCAYILGVLDESVN